MTESEDKELGKKSSRYCPDCEEEQIFVWAVWSGMEYFGYPPEQEYGWECTACGTKVREPLANDRAAKGAVVQRQKP